MWGKSINFQGSLPFNKLRLGLVPAVNKEALFFTIATYPKLSALTALPTAMAWEIPYTDIGQAKAEKLQSNLQAAIRSAIFVLSHIP